MIDEAMRTYCASPHNIDAVASNSCCYMTKANNDGFLGNGVKDAPSAGSHVHAILQQTQIQVQACFVR